MGVSVQIKRGSGKPASLKDGELAFDKDSEILYIGKNNEIVSIKNIDVIIFVDFKKVDGKYEYDSNKYMSLDINDDLFEKIKKYIDKEKNVKLKINYNNTEYIIPFNKKISESNLDSYYFNYYCGNYAFIDCYVNSLYSKFKYIDIMEEIGIYI